MRPAWTAWAPTGRHTCRQIGLRCAPGQSDPVADSSFFCDRRESALAEAGDYVIPATEGVIGPDHIKAELGEVLAGMHPGREHEDELTVFESLGIAVEDLAAAELVVRRAREQGVGAEVDF